MLAEVLEAVYYWTKVTLLLHTAYRRPGYCLLPGLPACHNIHCMQRSGVLSITWTACLSEYTVHAEVRGNVYYLD